MITISCERIRCWRYWWRRTDPKGRGRKQERDWGKALAGKSTLNRLELSRIEGAAQEQYKKIGRDEAAMDRLMVDLFLEAHRRAPRQIILDLDATDDPIHGSQEGRFFHGYYGHYCYLPLYIFCGEFLLCARLRPSDIDASAGAVEELERIVGQIRQKWPNVHIVIRADSGFCREEIFTWCEGHRVDYVIGFAKNARLIAEIDTALGKAEQQFQKTGKPARRFKDFPYRTRTSWSRSRRVIGKAEYLAKGRNPRFVVTSLPKRQLSARHIYERIYCARGEMENRIKEQQLGLFADRTSTATMRANQLRLLLLIGCLHVDAGFTSDRITGNRIRARSVHHDSPEAAENRCADPCHRASHLDSDGRWLSLCRGVCPDLRQPAENPASMLNPLLDN